MTSDLSERIWPFLGEESVALVSRYFDEAADPRQRFTGRRFERFAGRGDTASAMAFTSDDVVAVSMLSVRIPGRAAIDLLETHAEECSRLLSAGDLPVGVDLWDADESWIDTQSSAHKLWKVLTGIPGIEWVTAGKLLARKRPQLIPVYDRVVQERLGQGTGDDWWVPLREALRQDNNRVADRLATIRESSGVGSDISLLRILDVCVWMSASGEPEPVLDPET